MYNRVVKTLKNDGIDMELAKKIINTGAVYVKANRYNKMVNVLHKRRDNVRLILENCWDPSNADAVLRSYDSFGFQNFHVSDPVEPFSPSNLEYSKWLSYHRDSVGGHISSLKEEGYTVLATAFTKRAVDIRRVDLTNRKVAIIFGNEHRGCSKVAQEMADMHVLLPMSGFSQSFNVSVSAAIMMNHLTSNAQYPYFTVDTSGFQNTHAGFEYHDGNLTNHDDFADHNLFYAKKANQVSQSESIPEIRNYLHIGPNVTPNPDDSPTTPSNNSKYIIHPSPSVAYTNHNLLGESAKLMEPYTFEETKTGYKVSIGVPAKSGYILPEYPLNHAPTTGKLRVAGPDVVLPPPRLHPTPLTMDQRVRLLGHWVLRNANKTTNKVVEELQELCPWL